VDTDKRSIFHRYRFRPLKVQRLKFVQNNSD
jgi:hypothetical protein